MAIGGSPVERIGVELVAQTGKFLGQVDGAVNKAQGRFGGLAKNMGKALVAGAAVGGVALAGLGAAAAKMGMDFEASIAEVKTLMPDLSEEGFGRLKNDVLDLSKEMGIATEDMVPALYQAISAGVPPENVIDFLRVGAKASIGGVTDLATAVDGLTTIQNAFGYSADQTGRIADVMFTGVKLGKTTMEELSNSMFQAAPLAAALGLDIEDVVAATATLTKGGVPTAQAMTTMQQAMVSLTKPNADMNELLKETGYESGKALLESEGLAGGLELLSQAAEGDATVMTKAFGSVEAFKAVLGLTGENAEIAAADLDAVTNSAGASEKAYETMAATLKFKVGKAVNAVKIEMTKFGIKVLPLVERGFTLLGKGLKEVQKLLGIFIGVLTADPKKIRENFEALPDSIKPIGQAVKDAARFVRMDLIPAVKDFGKAALPVLKEVGKAVLSIARTVLPIVIDAVKQYMEMWQGVYQKVLEPYVLPILKKVGEFLLEHKPILIGVAAAILLLTNPWLAVVAAIVLVLAKWDEIRAFFEGIGETIGTFVDDVIQKVSDFPIIGEIIKDTVRMAKIYVETTLKVIKALFKAALDTIINTFKFWKAIFTGDWDAAWNAVKDQFGVILDLLSGLFGIALDAVKAIFDSKLAMVMGIGEDLGNLIVDAAKKVWEDLKAEFGDAVEAVGAWITGAISTITGYGTKLGNLILDEAARRWDLLKERFSAAVNAIATWLEGAAGAVTAIGTSLGNLILAGAGAVWNTITDVFGKVKEALAEFVNREIEGWKAIGTTVGQAILDGLAFVLDLDLLFWNMVTSAYSWIGEFGSNLVNIGIELGKKIWEGIKSAMGSLTDLIPGLGDIPIVGGWLGGGKQHGGPLAAGEWAQVNERGMEFFRPYSSGTVLPTAPGGGGGGDRWVNYGHVTTIYGPGRRTDDVIRDLDRMVS